MKVFGKRATAFINMLRASQPTQPPATGQPPARQHHAATSRPLERWAHTQTGTVYMMDIMTPFCICCNAQIEGPFIAVGAPYHGCLHAACAPYFPFDGHYPHALPVSAYGSVAFTPIQER
jgi:hypothetical protein